MRRSRKTSRGRFLAIVLAMAMVLQQAGITSLAEDAAAQAAEAVVTENGTETEEETSAETAAQTEEETSASSAAEESADLSVSSDGETTPDTSSIEETGSEETAGESEETTGIVAAESVTEAESESEADTEEATEAEEAAGTAVEALEETETAETESGSEMETEAPKTSFTYSDSRVVITATASEAANLPQDAELKADYIIPGSAAYKEAVSRIESQLGSTLGMDEENTQTAYILYDVYFLSGGERIEPEDGTVSVSMVFRQAVDLGMEGELINTEVVHVKDSGVAEVVTDYVNVNANGDVTAIGFTQDSFSVTGAAAVYKTQTSSGTNNNDLITDISGYYYLNSGNTKVELDGSTVVPSSVSTLYVKLSFAFAAGTLTTENPVLVFDVSGLCDLGSFVTTESGNVYNSAGEVVGTYSITSEGIITITYDTSAIDVTGNVSGYVDFGFTVYDSVKESGSEVIYSIGSSTLEFQYDISDLSVEKKGDYSSSDNTVTYTITVSSTNGTTEDVTLTDYLPSGVSAITSVTVTKNGVSYTIKEDNTSGTTLSLILDEMDAGDTYVITVVGTVTSDNDWTYNGTSYTTLSNTATATSGNASASGYCSLTVERQYISKSGYYDESTGLITWTIVINEAGEDITDYTLTDTLSSNTAQLYYWDSSAGEYVLIGTIDLTSGFVINDTNTGLTNSGTYTYKIVYTTDPGSPVNDTTVSNTVYLIPPTSGGNTGTYSTGESVTVPGTSTNLPYKIDKTADSTDTDSTTGYPIVDWTVTINVDTTSAYYTGSDVVLPAGIEISDSLLSSSMYMTKSQLAALTLTDGTNTYNYTITYVKTSDGTEYTGSDILSQLASDAKIISFTLVTDDDITLTTGTTLTMTYSSLLTATASGTYYNTVYVGSKSKTGGYTYESAKTVTKYAVDESGAVLTDEVNYYEADGILYWMIAIEGGFAYGDSITITDVLPEGMTYYAGAFTNGYALYAGDTIQYKYSQYFATVEIVSDGNSPETLTITITADKWAISTTAYLVFAVQIEDWDTVTYSQNSSGAYSRQYTNSISYTDSNSNTSTASASQTVVIPDLYKSGTVTVENNETTIIYTLNVNTNENTLGSSGTITLTDVLTITSGTCEIELDNSSLTVYDVTNSRTLDSTEYGCSISTDGSGTTTITLTLEDATAYTITYKYVVKAANVQQLTFAVSNSASISADISVQDSEQGQAQSSSAVSNSSGISIHKVAEGHNNVNIEGAIFDLYEYDETAGEFVYVASYTTSSTGKVNIAGASEYYLVYKLVEVYAPDGYDIWEEPLYFYVTFSSATSTTVVGESAVPSGSTLQAYADGSVIQLDDAIATGGTLDITKVVTGTEEGSGEYTVKITSEAATAQWSKVYGIVDGEVLTPAAIYDTANTSTQIGISFTLKAGQTAILCELTEGIEYTIEETLASGAAYTATYTLNSTATGNNGTDAPTVAFTDETTEYITITNAFETKTGELKITKEVTGATASSGGYEVTVTSTTGEDLSNVAVDGTTVGSEVLSADGKTITLTVTDNATVTLTNLPVATYTVTETIANTSDQSGYTLETTYTVNNTAVAGNTDAEAALTEENGYTGEVVITNTYTPETTSVTVTKTWVDDDDASGKRPAGITINLLADGVVKDSQTVTAAADGSWTCSFTNLPKYADGTEIVYTITEDAIEGYTTTVDGYNVTNTLDTGSLTVTKTVAGSVIDSTKEFAFTVTLSDTTLNGTFGEMTFTDGVAAFSLKNGESKTATGIPAGTTYTVTEDSYTEDGYVTTSTGTAGTIATDETQTAAFTNTITSVKISKVDVTTEEELEGAHIQILDEEGNVVEEWDSTDEAHEVTGLVPGETYTLVETVAPDGYEITTNTTFTLNEDGTIDTENTTTTVSDDGVLLVEDSMKTSETAVISVTKNLQLDTGDTLVAKDQIFYIGLYVDAACTNLYAYKTIEFKNASASTVTFTGLEIGRTYYIAECDADGAVLVSGYALLADGTKYMPDFGDGAMTATVTAEDGSEKTVTFTNVFYSIPDGFYREGTLTITKKLLGADGAALTSDAVFYAGIFTDASYTTLATNVDQNIVTLDLAGGSEVSVEVAVSIGNGETVTLYVTEVDADGNQVADADGFAYTVSVDSTEVTLDETNLTASVTITNQEIEETSEEESEEEEVETESETESEAVQTGDETPLALYFSLMLLAAAVMLAEVARRRRKDGKEE
ncbi:MAG: Cna B-type domain-containing protein [Clostridiales bacterium]|nr:Cna B-type domain-containing protein [Clostridiales bacterium]